MTGARVLVVDDSLTVRMDLADAFASGGFETVLRADLAGAREALDGDRFDLVVLDLLLPDGDGMDLLERVKRNGDASSPRVMLLANEIEVRERLRTRGVRADAYVGKPYDPAHVVTRARQLVDRPAARKPPTPSRLVLVVDDSLTAREELRGTLDKAGYEVVTASSGEEGLRIAARRRPSAIVVDGVMPGMDGPAFIRQVRGDSGLRTTPCILLTAAETVGELGALEAGADAYVRKERGHDVVLARLDALLRGATPVTREPRAGILAPTRILVVRPPDSPLGDLTDQLRKDGHVVVTAASPDDALDVLAAKSIDAVLIDAAPSISAALTLCTALTSKPSWNDVPLLLVGMSDDPDLVTQAINAGAEDYVSASSGTEVIRARLRAQLRRRQFEEENRAREAYARSAAVLETISDAFFAVDRSWRFIYVNHAMEALTGDERTALMGTSLWERCPWLAVGPMNEELRRATTERRPVTFEAPTPDDRWFEVRAFPHREGLSAHLRDVTERRRSQEVQGHLLGIVGHDLRTPLTAITASAALVMREGHLSDRQRRALDRVVGGAGRMARLINDLLDYSRARLGNGIPIAPRPSDLDAICRDSMEEVMAAHPGRRVEYRHEGDGQGRWDPDRIQQVLSNLLTNALRYGPVEEPVELAWRSRDGERVITVHNEGMPIDERLQEHIFEPFRRGDAAGNAWGGVGLGLYIVKEIVRAHGGHVTLRSRAGEGTTFTVELP